jgi:quercetin dioxygenase-like cupin family protein
MSTTPTFITLGPTGTCHENALLRYLEFQGIADARVELVGDFIEGLERVHDEPNSFLVQCSSHPDVHVVTERYRQEVFVLDTFMYPAKEMALLVRAEVDDPKTLGVVPAALGYPELTRWENITEEPANPIVARELLAGKYDAGVTLAEYAEQYPEALRVLERYDRVPWLFGGEPEPVAAAECEEVTVGEGYAVGRLDALGDGYGFRKVRRGLGVTAFGVNALVRPAGYETKWHSHDLQEELYFVHRGAIEMQFADGSAHRLEEGSFARVDASTPRKIRILGPEDTVYVCAGGKDGYIGHDGRAHDGM